MGTMTDHAGDVNQYLHWQLFLELESELSFLGDVTVELCRTADENGHQLDKAGVGKE